MIAALALFALLIQADFQTQYVAGLQALNKLDLPAAQTSLVAASKLQPANPRVWVALSQTYLRMGKITLANEAAVKAEKFGSEDPVTLRLLAAFYTEQNKFAHAAEIEVRAKAPERAMADYLQADQPRKAIELALAIPGWEGRADIRNLLGKAYEADGQILKTIPELQAAIRLQPGEESYYADVIRVLLAHYNFEAALQIADIALKRFPSSAQIETLAGVAHYGLNQVDPAVDAFFRSIALDPAREQPYVFLSRMMDQTADRVPEMAQRFVDYEHRNPESYLGYFLHAKADPGQAESLLRKSIALNGKVPESHFDLGVLLARRGANEEAEKELRRSVELNPKDPTAHYRLFRVLSALGKTREAEAELAVQRKVSADALAELTRTAGAVNRLNLSLTPP